MQVLSLLSLVFIFLIGGCNSLEYGKAIKLDSERIFKERKGLLKSFEFNGLLSEKSFCDECSLNKYSIKIKLEYQNMIIPFYSSTYPPYYSIIDSVLELSVNLNLYNSLEINNKLEKVSSSRFIKYKGIEFPILAEDEASWIPK